MIKLIKEYMEELKQSSIDLTYNKITRDTKTKNLVNKIETKKFKFEYDKRVILCNYDTVPYGYFFTDILIRYESVGTNSN